MEKLEPKLEPMVYCDHRIGPIRIADGEYRGIPYYVLSFGTHPCAYVDIAPIAPIGSMEINPDDIVCHGGVTYTNYRLATVEREGCYIGWDYAHCTDYDGYLGTISEYVFGFAKK
nr:MAG TPA: Polymerase acidic protein [Caudoviricetes sp.]